MPKGGPDSVSIGAQISTNLKPLEELIGLVLRHAHSFHIPCVPLITEGRPVRIGHSLKQSSTRNCEISNSRYAMRDAQNCSLQMMLGI